MVLKMQKQLAWKGLTLVEAMLAVVVLAIAVIGAANFRYYTTLDLQRSTRRITAARVGLLLCESWAGQRGAETYEPVTHLDSDLVITADTGPDWPEDFTLLGSYTVVLHGADYYATMSWKDVQTGLRALNVVVAWAQRKQGETNINDADRSFALTTYTQK